MLGTICVVVGALAIAVIGCEVLDPMTAMHDPSTRERRSPATMTRRRWRARLEEPALRSLSRQNQVDDASPNDGTSRVPAVPQVSSVEPYPVASPEFSRWGITDSNVSARSDEVSAMVPFIYDRTYSDGGEPGNDRY
jgi:hypothetical protein